MTLRERIALRMDAVGEVWSAIGDDNPEGNAACRAAAHAYRAVLADMDAIDAAAPPKRPYKLSPEGHAKLSARMTERNGRAWPEERRAAQAERLRASNLAGRTGPKAAA